MSDIIIYTTKFCPYCARAKHLLDRKDINFTEIAVDGNSKLRDEMTEKAGGRTSVPQIWINNVHVGGCDELYALDNSGKLDALLSSSK
ncbi:UNVERIFIED_CONTAM: hypothetical protein GTU68_052170 [Idotea baltica]|nr:hypothetical protein [Idotea baltica]